LVEPGSAIWAVTVNPEENPIYSPNILMPAAIRLTVRLVGLFELLDFGVLI
jgi:hypothetical protein